MKQKADYFFSRQEKYVIFIQILRQIAR